MDILTRESDEHAREFKIHIPPDKLEILTPKACQYKRSSVGVRNVSLVTHTGT